MKKIALCFLFLLASSHTGFALELTRGQIILNGKKQPVFFNQHTISIGTKDYKVTGGGVEALFANRKNKKANESLTAVIDSQTLIQYPSQSKNLAKFFKLKNAKEFLCTERSIAMITITNLKTKTTTGNCVEPSEE